jgi:outer membrane protein OmpA-like peptidoglycan-associated protein
MNEQTGSTWSENSDEFDDEAPVVVRRAKSDVAADAAANFVSAVRPEDGRADAGSAVSLGGSVRPLTAAGAGVLATTTTAAVTPKAIPPDGTVSPVSTRQDGEAPQDGDVREPTPAADSGGEDSFDSWDADDSDPITDRKLRLAADDQRQRKNAYKLMGASLAVLLLLAVVVRKSSIESTLSNKIKDVLAINPVDSANVQVEVVGRDVTLSGNVIDESMKSKIVTAVSNRRGVRAVDASKLVVGMPLSLPGAAASSEASVPAAQGTVPADGQTTVASVDTTATSLAGSTTIAPRLRPTVVEARIAGSVLTVKATVSDANVKDILVKRASDNLTSDELVNEVTIDPNDGQSDEVAHRRVGEFLEYLVKSGFNEANLRYDDGVMILDATVKTAVEGEQLRAEALRFVGDPGKLRPSIVVSALPAATSSAPGETTTTVAATSTTLSPEALVEQQRLDAAVSGRTISFEKESDKLSAEGRNIVDELAAVIIAMPDKTLRIEVGGHTDSKGSDGGNKRLSQRRATAVKNRLVLKGVPAARVDATGFGEANPIADNNTEDGKAQNRRIEFKIVGRAELAAAPAA